MAEHPKFKAWVKRLSSLSVALEDDLSPRNLKTEYLINGRWVQDGS